MQIQSIRSQTIFTRLKKLFSPHDPCQFKGTFPRRVATIHRVVEAERVRVLTGPDHCRPSMAECLAPREEAWPYDSPLPSGLARIPDMPAARPDLMAHRPPVLPEQRPLLSDPSVDVLI